MNNKSLKVIVKALCDNLSETHKLYLGGGIPEFADILNREINFQEKKNLDKIKSLEKHIEELEAIIIEQSR